MENEDKQNIKLKDKNYNRKIKKITISVIVVLMLIIATAGIVYFLNIPKNRFINNVYNFVKKEVSLFKDSDLTRILSSNKISAKGNIKINTNLSESLLGNYKDLNNKINNLDIKYNNILDKEERKMQTKLELNYEDNNLINIELLKDRNSYIKFNNILDKYIKLDFNYTIPKNIEKNDTYYIMNVLKKTIYRCLENDYFTEEDVKLRIEDEEIRTTKLSVVLTNDIIKDIIKNTLMDIKKDENALKILIKYSDKKYSNTEELIKEIEEYIIEIENKKYINDKLYINTYQKIMSNNIIAIVVEEKNVNVSSNTADLKVEYINYKSKNYDKIINVYRDNLKDTSLLIKDVDKTKRNIKIINSQMNLNGLLEIKDNNILFNYNLKLLATSDEYDGSINCSLKEKESNVFNYIINIDINSKDIKKLGKINLNLDGEMKLNTGEKIKDVQESVYYKDLLKEDSMKILVGIGEIIETMDLGKYFINTNTNN